LFAVVAKVVLIHVFDLNQNFSNPVGCFSPPPQPILQGWVKYPFFNMFKNSSFAIFFSSPFWGQKMNKFGKETHTHLLKFLEMKSKHWYFPPINLQ
jgi:hypothetical protein